ncbi:hypothetical protein ACX3T3_03915 [Actinotignum schaalii]|uniref:hypothetical protein n=1 Tax=Actinotignum TaxID=1653174 RepID=UPI00237D7603|nr:hypothetical protein [Actinotignum sanguinis]MDE1552239.1 hypothetical protein [Actinotignum sanguinis]
MTTTKLTTVPETGPGKNIPRDRWDRPLITPVGGGKPVAYTRCTTYVDALDDKANLMMWKARMAARGIAGREDLALQVKGIPDPDSPEGKKKLNKIVEAAQEHAGATSAATIGTELHAFTERLDRGEEITNIGEPWQSDIDAYQAMRDQAGLEVVDIETFVVNDKLKIGGTFDRIYRVDGKNYVGDLKTGSVDWGAGKFAMQLAVYANSQLYNPETFERTPLDVDRDYGIIVHLPKGENTCKLYWLNIKAGWENVHLATKVRQYRSHKFDYWMQPIEIPQGPGVLDLIEVAQTLDELAAIYHANKDSWSRQFNDAAAARKKMLLEDLPF